jgi:superfamily II DNA/RNA helicase
LDLPFSTALVIGGVPSAKQISQLRSQPRIIIATPGRLNDHLVNNKLLLQNVSFVVIDEADRMLDMGFAPQLKNIQSTLRGTRQTLMFSATFNSAVESIAQVFMNESFKMIRSSQSEEPVAELQQKILFIDKFKKNDRLLDELNATKGGVIIFCGNQGSCERMSQYLKEYGYSVDMIHGGVTQGQRNRVIRQFREGQIRIVVATDLLARGIDIPHVDHIINFDLPFQAEDFLHRIGRTARAGRTGNAITFVTTADLKTFKKLKPYLQGAKEVMLDPNFDFSAKTLPSNSRPQHKKVKKSEQKRVFDSSKKVMNKPLSKTIGSLEKIATVDKSRSDRYKEVPRSGKSKPSVWKSNNKPTQNRKSYS